jgi:hypothetical protein
MYLPFLLLHILGNNSRNSRLGEFNSRLGLPKFPIRVLREFARNRLIWLVIFQRKGASMAKIEKFPAQREKPGLCGFPVRR